MLDEAPRSETSHQLPRAVLHPSVLAPWHYHPHHHHHLHRHHLSLRRHRDHRIIMMMLLARSVGGAKKGMVSTETQLMFLPQGGKNFPHKIFFIVVMHHSYPAKLKS